MSASEAGVNPPASPTSAPTVHRQLVDLRERALYGVPCGEIHPEGVHTFLLAERVEPG